MTTLPALELPQHPFHPSDAMRESPALLGELLAEYLGEAETPDVAAFLFGWAPVRVFDALLSENDAAGDAAAPARVWLMHLSGYFGGVWLRGAIRSAQPENPIVAGGSEPSREAFDAVAHAAGAALEAARADAAALRSFLEAGLPQWVAAFGYNQGYLLQILDVPPEGAPASEDGLEARGPLWCEYRRPRLRSLGALQPAAHRLEARGPGWWREWGEKIPNLQAEAEKSGRAVWSTGLSVEGFEPKAYAQLVDLSSSFLEVTQAVALGATQAICDDDEGTGRRTARAAACLGPWTGSYAMGLMDPRPDAGDLADALPRIRL